MAGVGAVLALLPPGVLHIKFLIVLHCRIRDEKNVTADRVVLMSLENREITANLEKDGKSCLVDRR